MKNPLSYVKINKNKIWKPTKSINEKANKSE